MQLAAVYLCRIKHRDGARARDPVADFHLRNGAQVARLNWMADTSEKGLQQAYGLMVNYLYEPARIEQRSDQYTDEGTIALSSTIRKRLK
jgi:malonyl-CoA decarboxylase